MTDNLREVFNRIAPGWYNHRHRTIFPNELAELAEEWGRGKLLNLGCGHGADFLPFVKDFELYGIDFSDEMVGLAQKYAKKYDFQANLAVADMRNLPFGDGAFDCVIAVATYHHLPENQQPAAFSELKRVLKSGGEAFITVWNRWQPDFWGKGKEVMVPWKTKNEVLLRYYYLFTYGELKRTVEKAGLEVTGIFPEHRYRLKLKWFSRNICMRVKKT